MSYCRQNPTLWPGQSLSSPIRRRFFHPPNVGTRFLWCFMLFSTLKPGGWGSPDRSAGVWYRCTGSFCFNPSGPSQYMTLNSTWLLFKVRTCFWCMRTSPRIRLEAPQKRLWGASEVPQRRLRGASEAPQRRRFCAKELKVLSPA